MKVGMPKAKSVRIKIKDCNEVKRHSTLGKHAGRVVVATPIDGGKCFKFSFHASSGFKGRVEEVLQIAAPFATVL